MKTTRSLMMMNFDFELVCELPQYVGLTVTRSFWEIGSFKLTMKRGMPGWGEVQRERLLYFSDRPDLMLLIEKVTVTEQQVVADGLPLKGLCKRRICVPPSVTAQSDEYLAFGWDRFTGDAESAYLHYAANNLTAPEENKRKLPRMTLASNSHRGESLPWQARFDKLHELFADIGEATGLGWDVRPDFENKQYVFGAWAGVDRTGDTVMSGEIPRRAVLSRKLGNVDGTTLTDDGNTAVTTVYAGGSGEDENRLILNVGGDAVGAERREGWTDISGAEDADMLREGARRKLVERKLTLGVEVRESGLCRYLRDYDVGDIVTVQADEWQMNARLIAMEETHEGGKVKLKATFGDAPVTLTRMLRGSPRTAATNGGYRAATAAAPGLMSAADKVALDGMTTGKLTPTYNSAEWAAETTAQRAALYEAGARLAVVTDGSGGGTLLTLGANGDTTRLQGQPRNLLDNSDFRQPVNQRGWVSGTAVADSSYFLDRWKYYTGNTTTAPTLGTSGLTVPESIEQLLVGLEYLIGKPVTVACKFSDGEVLVASGNLLASETWTPFAVKAGTAGKNLYMACVGNTDLPKKWQIIVMGAGGTLAWVALYEGEYTADTLPEYVPKGYGAELLECQRYFFGLYVDVYRWANHLSAAENAYEVVPPLFFPCRMRATPTVTMKYDVSDGAPNTGSPLIVSPICCGAPNLLLSPGDVFDVDAVTASADL
ncbi:MAG: siphovirus ReqiPepy6 Gp37-like family protein [Eubacteriales bacterium]|nr:siphovirus ReqiPepy6 Gp37-like family protein [Eubacteriales bacterium]